MRKNHAGCAALVYIILTLVTVQHTRGQKSVTARGNSSWMQAPTAVQKRPALYFDPILVTTFAGDSLPGYADGIGSSAKFNTTVGLATDGKGNLYVADAGNN